MTVQSLAREQRAAQIDLSTLLLGELAELWRLLVGTEVPLATEAPALAAQLAPLIQQYGEASALVAADFYGRQREAAGLTAGFDVPLVDPAPEEQVATSLGVALLGNRRPAADRRSALLDLDDDPDEFDDLDDLDDEPQARTATDRRSALLDLDDSDAVGRALDDFSGSAQKMAAEPGRRTLERAIIEDPEAVGWARITDADPCGFCAMLASRGFIYLERQTALFDGEGEPYHKKDQCTVSARFRTDTSPLPATNQAMQDLWYRTGAYFTGVDALNAMRRALDAQRAGRDVNAAVFEGPKSDPDRYRHLITHDKKTVEEFRRQAIRGGTNGRIPGPDAPGDPRFGTRP